MAKTLCRVAGGGKPLKGNAEAGDVLAGKTFSNKQSDALTGSMPNNGAWSASTSGNGSVTIPAGYHNGNGTVSGAASYNQGVSDADARVNTSSASYNSGYANGRASALGYKTSFSVSGVGYQTITRHVSITGCSNYQSLSSNNISVGITGISSNNNSSWVNWSASAGVSGYNPSTGIVTVYVSSSQNDHANMNYNLLVTVVK